MRIFTPNVTQPIALKKQRDLSDKEYKRDYHVANDGNYCMAIYEGQDKKANRNAPLNSSAISKPPNTSKPAPTGKRAPTWYRWPMRMDFR